MVFAGLLAEFHNVGVQRSNSWYSLIIIITETIHFPFLSAYIMLNIWIVNNLKKIEKAWYYNFMDFILLLFLKPK